MFEDLHGRARVETRVCFPVDRALVDLLALAGAVGLDLGLVDPVQFLVAYNQSIILHYCGIPANNFAEYPISGTSLLKTTIFTFLINLPSVQSH